MVVLHVTGAAPGRERLFDRPTALELGEERLVRPPQDVGQHVESPTVRHPHDDLPDPVVTGQVECLVQHRHEHVQPLDAEALMAQVVLLQEPFEHVDAG